MTTYREAIYMVLDQLKLISDDSYYTEEHILFLIKKMRALILDKKYSNARVVSDINEANYQELEIPVALKSEKFGGHVYESDSIIPHLTKAGIVMVCPDEGMPIDKSSFIPFERIPYVGRNKWLKNFMYVAYGPDMKLCLVADRIKCDKIRLRGVFSDPEAAAEFESMYDGNILDWRFPLDEALLPQCIEMVLQELSGARYAPYDKKNNAADDNDIASREESANAPTVATRTEQ